MCVAIKEMGWRRRSEAKAKAIIGSQLNPDLPDFGEVICDLEFSHLPLCLTSVLLLVKN